MAESNVLTRTRVSSRDSRGHIRNLLDLPIGSVSRIVCTPGAVRANHYHKTDFHYCFLEKGVVEYYERPAGGRRPPKHYRFGPGQLFYTGPMIEHAMVFPETSILWCFARNSRLSQNYEADTVRVPSIVPPWSAMKSKSTGSKRASSSKRSWRARRPRSRRRDG